MEISILSEAPKTFIDQIWDVFFAAKSRGVSINAHFPWLVRKDSSTWYVVLKDHQQFVGGLCVKEVSNTEHSSNFKIAAIGLVCIDSKYRGQGYAKALLEAAVEEAKKRGYDALTLWTLKWDVYKPHGFKLQDDSIFGSIDTSGFTIEPRVNADALRRQIKFKTLPRELGLPPFALGGLVMATASAQVVILDIGVDKVVADWSGIDAEVVLILDSMARKKRLINAHTGDSLLGVLEDQGAKLNLSHSNLQMWLPLKKEFEDVDWTKIFRFSVLDRI
jgi:GNAT superfamily N-acetyltransferase